MVDHLTSTNIINANSLLHKSSARSMVCLKIDIRGISNIQALRLFEDVHFPNLTTFSTLTLPHVSLCGFLSSHESISTLILGDCLQLPCPLESVASLPRLYAVKGGAKCISSLISYATTRIFTIRLTAQDQGYLELFKHLSATNSFVSNFALEYHPEDRKFMSGLVSTMPKVSVIRLTEFPTDNRVRREFFLSGIIAN